MWNYLARTYGRHDGALLRSSAIVPAFDALPPAEWYALLWAYYLSNGLYDDLSVALTKAGQDLEAMKELRNPAHRAVEFHVAKLAPGDLPDALPIRAINTKIVSPIQRVWSWSNFAARKQLLVRWFACLGDLFIKIPERTSADGSQKVFLQAIDPRHVTDFLTDDQGHVQYMRLDIPREHRSQQRDPRGRRQVEYAFWTEIWDRERVRIWAKSKGPQHEQDQLGRPGAHQDDRDEPHGLPFVPFVWAPFTDIGEPRGQGVYAHCLTKIDECNRVATRLHDLIFRHDDVTWALEANAMDASGRPLPPPRLNQERSAQTGESDYIKLGGSRMIKLPGMSKLVPIIPSLDYNSLLSVLREQQEELRNDLPELRYFDVTAKSHVSGVSLRMALGDAIDRVREARGNFFSALVRAQAMALTIGQRRKIAGFTPGDIGTYEQGDFEHSIVLPDVIDLTPTEEATAWTAYTQAGLPPAATARRLGWTEERIGQLQQDRKDEIAIQAELSKQSAGPQEEQARKAQELQLEQARQAQEIQLEFAAKQRAQERAEAQELTAQQQEQARAERESERQAGLADHRARLEVQTELEIRKQTALAALKPPPAPKGKS